MEYPVHLNLGEEPCLLQASAIGLAALHIHFPQVSVVGDRRVELLHDGVHCTHKPATPQLPTLARRAGAISILFPIENSASYNGPSGELPSVMAVGASRQDYWTDKEREAQRESGTWPKSLREGVTVGTWLCTEVRALSHHMILLPGDGGRVQDTPETTAKLLGPFLPLTKVRSHSGTQSLNPALMYQR